MSNSPATAATITKHTDAYIAARKHYRSCEGNIFAHIEAAERVAKVAAAAKKARVTLDFIALDEVARIELLAA